MSHPANATTILAGLLSLVRFRYPTIVAGWVWDNSYPVRDGAITHKVRLNTNAFVFGLKSECEDIISHLEYHP